MSTVITFNGANFIIPSVGEVGWGNNVSSYLISIAANTFQKTAGAFTLSAEADFGSSFGLKSLYYKSRSSNIALSGILRLNNNSDAISFRNFANSADLPLTVNASDQLTFNGIPISNTSPSFAHLALTDTTNQLTLGTTNTITISSIAPSSSHVYTIPDSGSDATFVMTAGAQLIGGVKTFTSDVHINGTTIFPVIVEQTVDALIRVVASNDNTTSGQTRLAGFQAQGGSLFDSIAIIGGTDSSNNSVQMLNGTNMIQFGLGSNEKARMTLQGTFKAGDGSSSNPTWGFETQPAVGMWHNGAGVLGFQSVGGLTFFGANTGNSIQTGMAFESTRFTNQIILNSLETITINAPRPAVSRVYTIPDAGIDSTFLLADGPLSISGTITLSSLTASLPLQLDGSKNIISSAINLSGSQVTATLPPQRGGTGVTHKIFTSGTYIGNGVSQTIAHGLSVTPTYIMIIQTNNGTQAPEVWSSDFPNQSGGSRETNGNFNSTAITAADATNISIGSSGVVNTNLLPYQWLAWAAQ